MPVAGNDQEALPPTEPAAAAEAAEAAEDELAAIQTGAERLLLATMQCSLSLIGFGFTIYQIFSDAAVKTGIARASTMANRVGIALLALGLILLGGGLWANAQTRRQLDARRARLVARGRMAASTRRPPPPVFVVAFLLLLLTLAILGAIAGRLLGLVRP